MKHAIVVSPDTQQNLLPDFSTARSPHYIFEVPQTIHSVETASLISEGPLRANGYKDALPRELLRPPRSPADFNEDS